ncbi:hypothetical protein B0H17DRAFT_1187596 [Mycena rosella]|uniref:Uncharacterized protein n=1 Tax=Mycena rosella TaxID=1033263 RepID=A0AAD7FPG9_MYCRO|nr:hypothetical protein B0H17DRAFT_1187596 [Mycena rosella]
MQKGGLRLQASVHSVHRETVVSPKRPSNAPALAQDSNPPTPYVVQMYRSFMLNHAIISHELFGLHRGHKSGFDEGFNAKVAGNPVGDRFQLLVDQVESGWSPVRDCHSSLNPSSGASQIELTPELELDMYKLCFLSLPFLSVKDRLMSSSARLVLKILRSAMCTESAPSSDPASLSEP